MTELEHCPQCGVLSPPERYERSAGFRRFRVKCPHHSVTGRTQESTDMAWNRLMEREQRRCMDTLARKQTMRERKEARMWRPVAIEPLPCPICGNLPYIRHTSDAVWSVSFDERNLHCHCRTCRYDTSSAPSRSKAIEKWNEYVRENSREAKV